MYIEDKNGNRDGANAWLHSGVTHIEFQEHTFGLVETVVYHAGDYLNKKLTAKQIFENAADQRRLATFLTAKEKEKQLAEVERLKKVAQKYKRMNVWYLFDWGSGHGGYRTNFSATIDVTEGW